LLYSSTQGSISNHSVTLIASAIRLIADIRRVFKFVYLLTYLLIYLLTLHTTEPAAARSARSDRNVRLQHALSPIISLMLTTTTVGRETKGPKKLGENCVFQMHSRDASTSTAQDQSSRRPVTPTFTASVYDFRCEVLIFQKPICHTVSLADADTCNSPRATVSPH